MDIEKPIFMIGAGRSGTTILYHLLALHPEVCWFSNLTNRYPQTHQLALSHRLFDVPLVGPWLKRRLPDRTKPSLRPSEGEIIFRDYAGFVDGRRMGREDLTPDMEGKLGGIIGDHIRYTGKPRFLSKRTATTQRIEIIDRMFPDAYYVHLLRDGRATAASLQAVRWWKDIDIWWLGGNAETWEEMGNEPVALCGQHWQRNVQELMDHRHLFGDRYLELRYEDLVQDTHRWVKEIVSFCGLDESPGFLDYVPKELANMNYKWETQFNDREKAILNETVGPYMRELGYEI